jgi:hypothetical protein
MKIGLVFPQTEFGNDPAAMRDYAQTAEGLGFTHILAYDHVLGANPNRPGGWKGPYTERPLRRVSGLAFTKLWANMKAGGEILRFAQNDKLRSYSFLDAFKLWLSKLIATISTPPSPI